MSRQKQVSVTSILKAMTTAKGLVKSGKITKSQITAELAESLQLDIADLETRYKRFSANKRYQPIFEAFDKSVGGVEFATVGQQGRPGVSDEALAEFAALLAD